MKKTLECTTYLPRVVCEIIIMYFSPFSEIVSDERAPHRENTPFKGKCEPKNIPAMNHIYFGYKLIPLDIKVPDNVLQFMIKEDPYGRSVANKDTLRRIGIYRDAGVVPWLHGAIATFTCMGTKYIACTQPVSNKSKNGEIIYVFLPEDKTPLAAFSCQRRGYFNEYVSGYYPWNRQTEKERSIHIILDQLFT